LTLFFFQAEDGIRDFHVTGVQTCALPISLLSHSKQTWQAMLFRLTQTHIEWGVAVANQATVFIKQFHHLQGTAALLKQIIRIGRSEERRVGKEGRSPWSPNHSNKK